MHVDAWTSLWRRGTMEVDSDLHLARAVSASQYYILSSVPDVDDPRWPFIGLSPSGLAWGDDQVITQQHTQLQYFLSIIQPSCKLTAN